MNVMTFRFARNTIPRVLTPLAVLSAIAMKVSSELETNAKILTSVQYHCIRIRACQNSFQYVVIAMDLLNVNVILVMRVILLMMNVELSNAPKIRNVKVIGIILHQYIHRGI